MVFTEPAFLFLLLPVALLVNSLAGNRLRNLSLFALSLLFYFIGEGWFALLMVLSCGMNYVYGLWVDKTRGGPHGKRVLALAVASNLGLLAVFKYTGFILESLDRLLSGVRLSGVGLAGVPLLDVHLPIGISFFTFQAVSYLVDVYRGDVPVERRWWNLALYISLFAQLIAGPIVRYSQLIREVHQRTVRLGPFALGVERFIIGLAKKTLVANTLAVTADAVFDLAPGQLSMPLAWIGLLAYTFQIYYDFSGYSDMAIGIGLMLGFRFPENFNYPYVSRSMSEFWRRWHISLSTWFRDYLYIPLGGNRKGSQRTGLNLLVVFFLCGLWHGASWAFVAWGLFHGFFLMVERLPWSRRVLESRHPLGLAYTWLVVLFGWVLFRSESLSGSGDFLRALAGTSAGSSLSPWLYLDAQTLAVFFLALLFSAPVYPACRSRFLAARSRPVVLETVYALGLGALWVLCLSQIAANTYDPFIYYRF